MQMQARLARIDFLPLLGIALALALGIFMTSPQSRLVAGIVGALVYLLIILRSPFAGFLLWMVSFPFSQFLYLDIYIGNSIPDLTLTRLCAILLLAGILAQVAVGKRKPLPITALDVFAILSLVGIGLSISMSGSKMAATRSFTDAYVLPVLFYWIAKNMVQTGSDRKKVVIAIMIVGAYAAAIAVQEQFTGEVLLRAEQSSGGMYSENVRRVVGVFGSPVIFGVILGMTLPFTIHELAYATDRTTKLSMICLTALVLLGLYASAVRTAWITAILGIIIMIVVHPVLRQRHIRRIVIALLTLSIVVAIPFGGKIENIIYDSPIVADRVGSQGPIIARLIMYSTAWRVVREFPMRGVGYESFSRVYTRYLTGWGDIVPNLDEGTSAPHNSFVYVLVSSGLLGFVPYFLMFIAMIIYVARAHRRAGNVIDKGLFVAFWVAILVYWLNSMTVDMVYLRQNSIYFFALLGAFLAPIAAGPRHESENAGEEASNA